jgi:hypothetical protein
MESEEIHEVHERFTRIYRSWGLLISGPTEENFLAKRASYLQNFNNTIRDTLLAHPDAVVDRDVSSVKRTVLRKGVGGEIIADWFVVSEELPETNVSLFEIACIEHSRMILLAEFDIPLFKYQWRDDAEAVTHLLLSQEDSQ